MTSLRISNLSEDADEQEVRAARCGPPWYLFLCLRVVCFASRISLLYHYFSSLAFSLMCQLRELFRPFGRIERFFLAVDKVRAICMCSRSRLMSSPLPCNWGISLGEVEWLLC